MCDQLGRSTVSTHESEICQREFDGQDLKMSNRSPNTEQQTQGGEINLNNSSTPKMDSSNEINTSSDKNSTNQTATEPISTSNIYDQHVLEEVSSQKESPGQDETDTPPDSNGCALYEEFKTSEERDVSYAGDDDDFLNLLFKCKTKEKLIDGLLGCAYGQALGDAYGLSTEFQTRSEVAVDYPDTSKVIPFPDYILTGHSKRWSRGDWTDDTDQWILILETLTEDHSDLSIERVFASKLTKWIRHGYPVLNDYAGMGLGANVAQVVYSHNYLETPLTASEEVWKRSNYQAAPNGAVMRCSASAFVHFNDLTKVKETAEILCKTTHFDPRCIGSCLAVCLTVSYLLRGEFKDDDIEELVDRVQNETLTILGNTISDDHRKQFLWHIDRDRTLEELNFDEPKAIGYTYKCLAAGFYGLRSKDSFEITLNNLIRFGGDADTNGAVCGTMFGARHGYKNLPSQWLQSMPYKKWFDKKIINCLLKHGIVTLQDIQT